MAATTLELYSTPDFDSGPPLGPVSPYHLSNLDLYNPTATHAARRCDRPGDGALEGIMTMLWWHWLIVGLVLAGLELGSGGFFVIFFGVGALAVGCLSLMGLAGPIWVEWLLFSLLSILSLALFRGRLQRRFRDQPAEDVDNLVGEIALPLEAIGPGAVGRAELRGTTWSARNAGASAVSQGERSVVERVEGLLLEIRSEEGDS